MFPNLQAIWSLSQLLTSATAAWKQPCHTKSSVAVFQQDCLQTQTGGGIWLEVTACEHVQGRQDESL